MKKPNCGIPNGRTTNPIDTTLICAVVQLFGVVLTVMYSSDPYDIWDLGIAGYVIYLWWQYKSEFAKEPIPLYSALIGFSIAIMIIPFTIGAWIWSLILYLNNVSPETIYNTIYSSIFYADPWASVIEFLLAALIFVVLKFCCGHKVEPNPL